MFLGILHHISFLLVGGVLSDAVCRARDSTCEAEEHEVQSMKTSMLQRAQRRKHLTDADAQLLERAHALALEDLRNGRGPPAENYHNPDEAFHSLDQDGDGFINVEDILRLEHKVAESGLVHGENASEFITPSEVRAQIADVDGDGDGKISMDELEKSANKTFEKEQHKQGVDAHKLATLLQSGPVLKLREERRLALLDIEREGTNESRGAEGEVYTIRNQATIIGLYTFGAPGTANPQLYNMQSWSRCFPGQRVYNAGREPATFWGYYERSDPVPWITNILWYQHAKMESLKLKEWESSEPERQSCQQTAYWPQLDGYVWVDAHMHDMYNRFTRHQEHWPFVNKMSKFTEYVYWPSEKQIADEVAHLGWRLIGASVSRDSWGATDQVALFQADGSHDCVITFKGTDIGSIHEVASDWLTNLNAWSTNFCGFGGVHQGFANELRRSTSSPEYYRDVKPKLPHCRNVYSAGHSLGGAQAELFAACINNHAASSTSDFKSLTWVKSYVIDFPAIQG